MKQKSTGIDVVNKTQVDGSIENDKTESNCEINMVIIKNRFINYEVVVAELTFLNE